METIDSKAMLEIEACITNQCLTYTNSMALRCGIQLGIPEIICSQDGPVAHADLVSKLSIAPAKSGYLKRLMRLLVHNGFFTVQTDQDGQEGYVSTPLSKVLSKNFSAMVLLATDPVIVTPSMFTADWFRGTSSSPFEAVHGMNIYSYFASHPEMNANFNAAMAGTSEAVIKALLKDLKPMLEGFETLVDVGGGNGTVAKVIAEAAPHLKCTVYDLPQVITNVKDKKDDITYVAGNMFEFVPSANIMLIKSVLIDWGDDKVLTILKRCKEAATRESCGRKVIIVDSVIDTKKVDTESMKEQACFDVYAMNVLPGKERTEAEWKEMFLAAGFTTYKITPSVHYNSIIEVFP